MDTILLPMLDELRACTCTALETTLGGPTPCSCGILPGTLAVADWCSCNGSGGCGQAWVRVDRIYSSSQSFPSPDAKPLACVNVLAAVLEVGVYRCQPSQKGTVPPSPADMTHAALVQADDSIALARAILCCSSITKRPYVLGTYTPRDGGACGGGAWTVTVQLTR